MICGTAINGDIVAVGEATGTLVAITVLVGIGLGGRVAGRVGVGVAGVSHAAIKRNTIPINKR